MVAWSLLSDHNIRFTPFKERGRCVTGNRRGYPFQQRQHPLLNGGAVGAISTHDLALTEMADDPAKAGVLVHMESNNPDDPLDFDYLVKPGVSMRSNAMAIVRMLGISTIRTGSTVMKA
jgi:CBS domain-containing protein